MRTRIALLLAMALSTGCAAAPSRSSPVSQQPTSTPTATPLPTPTPRPTPIPAADAVVESFRVAGSGIGGKELQVIMSNPNTDVGVARARLSVAAIAGDGSVIAVFGNVGVPGSQASTIYQLPPGGEFIYVGFPMPESAPQVASVELSILDPWIAWDTVHPIIPTLIGLSLVAEFGVAKLQGRLVNPGSVTVNMWVGAIYSEAGSTGALAGVVECVKAGESRAFEVLGAADGNSLSLTRAIAYPTTVEPLGSVQFCG